MLGSQAVVNCYHTEAELFWGKSRLTLGRMTTTACIVCSYITHSGAQCEVAEMVTATRSVICKGQRSLSYVFAAWAKENTIDSETYWSKQTHVPLKKSGYELIYRFLKWGYPEIIYMKPLGIAHRHPSLDHTLWAPKEFGETSWAGRPTGYGFKLKTLKYRTFLPNQDI